MSDIVERLRANTHKYPGFENMNTEAATEIERLRNEYEIKVGDIVRLNTGGYADPHTHGRVVQIDTIRTLQGIPNVNVYVRWFSVDGKPDDSPSCFAPAELFKCPPARETR